MARRVSLRLPQTVAELRGKRIGVANHLGSPPYLFASRVLVANGIDPAPDKNDVTWLVFQPDVLGMAVSDGRVDAVATSDPIGTILVGRYLDRDALAFLFLIVVLMVRPQGLTGARAG